MPLSRTGATAVEFAVTFPVLIIFLFAAINLSMAASLHHTVDHAAYEAARQGAISSATIDSITLVAERELEIFGIRDATITVLPSDLTDQTDEITVRISVPIGKNIPIGSVPWSDGVISSECTMRREKISSG